MVYARKEKGHTAFLESMNSGIRRATLWMVAEGNTDVELPEAQKVAHRISGVIATVVMMSTHDPVNLVNIYSRENGLFGCSMVGIIVVEW